VILANGHVSASSSIMSNSVNGSVNPVTTSSSTFYPAFPIRNKSRSKSLTLLINCNVQCHCVERGGPVGTWTKRQREEEGEGSSVRKGRESKNGEGGTKVRV
jgi:hypothetical protein